jgi:hypothetical protein
MSLDTSILQTKTVGEIVEVLKRARGIAKENTRCAKGIVREAEMVIAAFEKAERKTKRVSKEVLSNRSLSKPYTVNL